MKKKTCTSFVQFTQVFVSYVEIYAKKSTHIQGHNGLHLNQLQRSGMVLISLVTSTFKQIGLKGTKDEQTIFDRNCTKYMQTQSKLNQAIKRRDKKNVSAEDNKSDNPSNLSISITTIPST